MRTKYFMLICIVFSFSICQVYAFDFHWEITETPEGQEIATVVQPVQVIILDEPLEIADNSASIRMLQKYSVHLGTEWNAAHAYRLLSLKLYHNERTLFGIETSPICLYTHQPTHP